VSDSPRQGADKGPNLMKLLVLSDIHGKIASLKSIAGELASADAVLVAGDITHFGGKDEMIAILDEIKKYSSSLHAVPGNCDPPGAAAALAESGVGIDRKTADVNGIAVAGIGGSLPCPGSTPNEFGEADFKQSLEREPFSSLEPGAFIFVSHQPPFGTKVDKAWIGGHVGSREIRNFIETKKPVLCITGHIHESRGIDAIGETRIVNPGAFKSGNYAKIEMEGMKVREILLKSV
jgi:Icc-related predicted phosphoesterase